MKGAFGTFSILTKRQLDDSAYDRIVRAVMEERGLRKLIRSDGCSYPVVGRAGRGRKVKVYEVLDPYSNWTTTCQAVASVSGLWDGWNIHIRGGGRRDPAPSAG
jgi:hypothetical protein